MSKRTDTLFSHRPGSAQGAVSSSSFSENDCSQVGSDSCSNFLDNLAATSSGNCGSTASFDLVSLIFLRLPFGCGFVESHRPALEVNFVASIWDAIRGLRNISRQRIPRRQVSAVRPLLLSRCNEPKTASRIAYDTRASTRMLHRNSPCSLCLQLQGAGMGSRSSLSKTGQIGDDLQLIVPHR